ncbi:hypothetical protein QLX08_008950 [Tetragonisca angustula]|uniref:GPN-loop GTPase 3 n=1 Tax=Tetragonisca angustula TaxID=166442 RepID=A0AAW0ZHS3_9HYME
MRYAQLVMGPAGSGKSTYCSAIQQHAASENKAMDVVNLDPAAEYFDYNPLVDIRELIHLDDVMEDNELRFGPNGGLVFCMEYIIENSSWLEEKLGDVDDDYVIFDCPGQIELYTHMTIIRQLITMLQNLNFRICGVFLIDSQFMIDGSKFLSDMEKDPWNEKYRNLSEAIGRLIEDYSLVRFYPLNIKDEENMADIKLTIDNIIQYGEDADVKIRDFDESIEDDDKDINYDINT